MMTRLPDVVHCLACCCEAAALLFVKGENANGPQCQASLTCQTLRAARPSGRFADVRQGQTASGKRPLHLAGLRKMMQKRCCLGTSLPQALLPLEGNVERSCTARKKQWHGEC